MKREQELMVELVRQAFSAYDKRIEVLEKKVEEQGETIKKQQEKLSNMEELNGLLDKAITDIKEFVIEKLGRSGDEEINLMEDYKFGTSK